MSAFKYNWGVSGHDKVIEALEKDISEGNLAHAYLFAGPDSIGKFTVAKKLANILQCSNGCCGECNICQEIAKGYHADTIEIGDDGESIKIEQIRGIVEKLNMTKTSEYKVLLIKNIERMTLAASNALLKTLEDPPGRVVFVLTTQNFKEILATIISRVRLMKFARLTDRELETVIRDKYPLVDEEKGRMTCLYSHGRPGRAISLMENEELFNSYRKLYEDVETLISGNDRAAQFVYVGGLAAEVKEAKDGSLIGEFLDVFELVLRQQMLNNVNGENAVFPAEKCVTLLQKVQETRNLLKRNINTRLLLENLMLQI